MAKSLPLGCARSGAPNRHASLPALPKRRRRGWLQLPNVEAATAPLREVIEQIEDDLESRLLLELIVADETSTIDCLHRCAVFMGIEDAIPGKAKP